MMKNIKTFVTDLFGAFCFFVYEGLVILTYIGGLIVDTIYNFLTKFLFPFIYDTLSELNRFLHFVHFELLNHLSLFFLKLSQLSASLSKIFLEQAEEKSSKRVWF